MLAHFFWGKPHEDFLLQALDLLQHEPAEFVLQFFGGTSVHTSHCRRDTAKAYGATARLK